MSSNAPTYRLRRLGWRALCAGVTIATVAYVLVQVTWKDRLVVDGVAHSGWMKHERHARIFHADDGTVYPIPPDPDDPLIANPFTPGLVTLVRDVHLGLFMLALLLTPSSVFFMALRWRLLLRTEGLDPGMLTALRFTWISALTCNLLPGSTGADLAKIVCICRRAPGKRVAAAMTVVMSRLLGLFSLVLVGAGAILVLADHPAMAVPARIAVTMLVGLVAGLAIALSRRLRALVRLDAWLPRLPLAQRWLQLDACLLHYRNHPRTLVACVVISVLMQFFGIGSVYLLGLALGMKVAAGYYFVFLPVIYIAGSATPAINGLGVREASFQVFFAGVGAAPSAAMALALLYRFLSLLASLPGAVPFYQEARAKPADHKVQAESRIAA
jgi:uncharacterized protein (TIRG00374 family)